MGPSSDPPDRVAASDSVGSQPRARRFWPWSAGFLLLALLTYNLNSGAASVQDLAPGRSDSWGAELTALSLVTTGDFDLDETTPPGIKLPNDDFHWVVRGAGHFYSKYPLLPPLLATPLFWASHRLCGPLDQGDDRTRELRVARLGKITNTILSTLMVGVVFVCLRRLASPGRALAGAAAMAFSSCTWFYSQNLWTHAAGGLFLALATWIALVMRDEARAGRPASARLAALLGACLALSVAARYTNAVAGGLLVVGLVLSLRRVASDGGAPFRLAGLVGPMLLAALPFALLQGWFNTHAFGSPLSSSYGAEATGAAGKHGWKWQSLPFDRALLEVVVLTAAYFTSTSFGLFVLSPLFLLAGVALVRAARRDPMLATAALAVLATAALHASWWAAYHYTLGYRFLMDVLPLAALGFAFVPGPGERGRAWRVLWIALFVIGVAVQVLAVARFAPYASKWFDDLAVQRFPWHFWAIRDSVPWHLAVTPR